MCATHTCWRCALLSKAWLWLGAGWAGPEGCVLKVSRGAGAGKSLEDVTDAVGGPQGR
jgi:hypothetical protein